MANPFLSIHARALNGGYHGVLAALFSSPEYKERTEFAGQSKLQDLTRTQLNLLERVALDPRFLDRSRALLGRGVVHLELFGVSNPTPLFELDRGSELLQQLRAAVDKNASSAMFRAAQRVLKWREPRRASRGRNREDVLVGRLREQLTWPDRTVWTQSPDLATKMHENCIAQLRTRRETIRALRHERLHALSRAATPGVSSWTQLLEDISIDVFQPREDSALALA
ncbi:hypothetical protein D3C71_25100 [compost metagenome]